MQQSFGTDCGSGQLATATEGRIVSPMIESAEEFIRLRLSSEQSEYSRSALEPAAIEVWIELIEKHPDMRRWVIHNKTVPISILERLSRDSDVEIRQAVATKRKLTKELQWLLAHDVDEYVRQRIAYNAKSATEVLEALARGADYPALISRTRLAHPEDWQRRLPGRGAFQSATETEPPVTIDDA